MKPKAKAVSTTKRIMLCAVCLWMSASYADEVNPKTETQASVNAGTVVEATTVVNATSAMSEAPETQPAPTPVRDPLEKFNRGIFAFNDRVDRYFLKPIATFYNTIMPKPLNQGIHNFFNNLGELPTIANDILQLNFYQLFKDSWRFAINSTIGVAGFFDVASRMGLKYYANDFGLTMARYGWKNSTFIMIPLFGPSTLRDTIEIPVDYYAFSVYPYIEPESRRYQLYGLGVIDRRAQLLQFQNVFEEAAIDRYVFVRNAYMQRRAYQINQVEHLGFKDQQAKG